MCVVYCQRNELNHLLVIVMWCVVDDRSPIIMQHNPLHEWIHLYNYLWHYKSISHHNRLVMGSSCWQSQDGQWYGVRESHATEHWQGCQPSTNNRRANLQNCTFLKICIKTSENSFQILKSLCCKMLQQQCIANYLCKTFLKWVKNISIENCLQQVLSITLC